MKVYTRTGDKGETSLIGGTRVPKYHARIEAYGTVDELIAYIALIRDQEIEPGIKKILIGIQDRLMTCAAILAADCENCEVSLPEMKQEDVVFLEKEIDRMEKELPPLRSFLLPGGHPTVSYCHIARTVCRRAERTALKLGSDISESEILFKYLNRLADYLFVLSRKLSKDLDVIETQWNPQVKK